jgi:pimeloyl-ACP methyl ester carboxylesterase/DNA-binding CsgD family transcriptional regulator
VPAELEQELRFCTAADGVRIAYATIGDGYPLVYVTGWPVHLELEWQTPFVRQFLCELASGVTLIRYDMRGSGLSDRDVADYSLPALHRDLEAVVAQLSLSRYALLGLGDLAAPLAITHAARYPSAVTHVMLNSAYVRGSDLATPDRQEATINFVRNFGFPIFEFADAPTLDAETQRALREINECSASHEMQAAILRTMYDAEATPLLANVTMPVLVMHARGDPLIPFTAGRELAIRLPHARYVPFEGTSASALVHQHILITEIRRFLGVSSPSAMVTVPGASGGERPDDLSPREIEVLREVAMGRTSREIAESLVLSTRTVERHISNVYAKIGVNTRAQATAYALTHGLMLPRTT